MRRRIFISLLLISAMMITSFSAAFANTHVEKNQEVSIIAVNSQKIIVKENGKVSFITLTEKGNKSTVSVEDKSNGKSYSFVRNNADNTITSSITGNTIPISDSQIAPSEVSITAAASTSTWYEYVSYKSIAKALGDITTATALIAFVMSFLGMPAIIATVTTAISGAIWAINGYLPAAASNHGVRLTLHYKTITKHQGGSVINVKIKEGIGMKLY